MGKFRILSLDGGGIKGIVPGMILVSLEKRIIERTGNPNAKIADYFDMIVGTSTGGILACFYLVPENTNNQTQPRPRYSAQEAVNIYLEHGNRVFKADHKQILGSMAGLRDEKFSASSLEGVLHDYFQDVKLSQLIKPCLVTSYNVKEGCTQFFAQHDAVNCGDSHDFFVREVARATSAAPTFFEIAKVTSMSGVSYPLVDGAVFANNPTLCAYAEVHARFCKNGQGFKVKKPQANCEPEDLNEITAKDMVILSLGTGSSAISHEYDKVKNWGLLEWAQPVIAIMMSGVSQTVDYQLRQIFDSINRPNQYLRIDPKLEKKSPMAALDNAKPDNLKALKELGIKTAEIHSAQLDTFLDLLEVPKLVHN